MSKSLDGILAKLSHSLPEVRCRALRSLISKLDHGLIHESNLVPERSFIVKFLEWFNFDSTPMSEDVLQLLRRLSSYENARMVLISLGGVEFFTNLRNDVVGSALHDIDAILKNMTTSSASKLGNHHESDIHVAHDSRFFSKPSSMLPPDAAASYLSFAGFPWHFLTATDRHVLSSTGTSLSSSDPALVENACLFLLDVVLHDFPAEIFLQRPTIINTLLILLRSGADVSLLCIACKCLSLIARNLTARILSYQDPDYHCPRQGLPGYYNSIKELTSHPRDSVKVDSNEWERNGGDGRDGTISSSLSSEYDGSLQMGDKNFNVPHTMSGDEASFGTDSTSLQDDSFLASQLSQLSVIEFVFSSLQAVADLLNVDSPILFFDAYEVACNCVEVLSHLFNIKSLWNEDHGVCDGVRTRIKLLSGIMSRCILHHYHMKCDPESETWCTKSFKTTKDMMFHRIAFQVCGVLFLRFLQSIISDDRIVYLSSVKSTENVLVMIAADQAFKISSPDLHDLAVTYLKHFEARHQFEKLQDTLHSIQCIQNFKESSARQGDYKTLLMQAEGSIAALQYHNPDGFVSQVVNLISMVNPSYGDFHCTKAKTILLKLLCHSDLKVQNHAYMSCQKVIVKLFENIDESSVASNAYFMINGDVLNELIMHGMCSNSTSIKNAAHDIVMSLLRGKYFMEEQLWCSFLENVKVHLPTLQSYAGDSEILNKVILDFISSNFDCLNRLICLLRFLILKSRKVRSFISPLLLEFLSSSAKNIINDYEDKLLLEGLLNCLRQMDDYTDRLVVNDAMPLLGNKTSLRSLAANEQLILQMLSVLRSTDTSKAKRLATFQQLGCMLSVKESHEMFLRNNGLRTIKQRLCQISSNSILTKHENDEATSCILIMLKLCGESDAVRTSLLELPTVLSLLRFVVLSHNFSDTSNLAAQVLAILIMRDVLKTERGNPESVVSHTFRMSQRLISHYHIALPCSPLNVISAHRHTGVDESLDSIETGPASFAIASRITLVQNHLDVRLAIENLQEEITDSATDKSDSPVFQRIALVCSNPDTYLEEFTCSVSSAKMHAAVSRAVCLLRALLLTYPADYRRTLLNSEQWRLSLESFVLVHPSSIDDIKLLCDIVSLLSDVISTVPSSQLSFAPQCESIQDGLKSTLVWYIHIICGSQSFPDIPLLNQLKSPSLKSDHLSGLDPRAKEQRRLCKSILSMMSHISSTILVLTDKAIVHKFQSTLCRIILLRLKLANTPRYYDLPSMEVTLDCLLHSTAACAERKHSDEFFYDDDSMPVQLMSSLFEVVSAFHIENSGSSMSYMGRGVSKTATHNIVNIVFGAANRSNIDSETFLNWLDMVSQGFPLSVKLSGKYAAAKHKKSYKWILALWPARDPLIRYCGLLLTSLVTRTTYSCAIMQEYFRDYPGGIWHVLLSVVFDSTECSAVRTQAAYVCCNLVLHFVKCEDLTVAASDFAKILRQYGFYQGCVHILSRYYPCCWVKPSPLILYPHMYPMEISSSYASEETIADGQSNDSRLRPDSRSRFSTSSNASDFPPEWEASVTPNLMAAVCHLLSNIFSCFRDLNVVHHHADITQSISSFLDAALLEMAITKFYTSENVDISKGRLQFFIKSMVKFFSESCKMLHIYMSNDDSGKTFQTILNNTNTLSNIVRLATSTTTFDFDDSQMVMNAMDLLSFLIVNSKSSSDMQTIQASIMAEWSRVFQCLKCLLSHDGDIALTVSSLTLLTNVASLMDVDEEDSENSSIIADVVELCEICIGILKSSIANKQLEMLDCHLKCASTLQSLFVFQQCRINAVSSGFVAYLIGEINSRMSALSKEYQIHNVGKSKRSKNIKNSVATTVSIFLRILSSVLIYMAEVQASALKLGFHKTLQSMWKSTGGANEMKATLLKTAICYSVSSEETSASLAMCTSGKDCFMSYVISDAQEMARHILGNNKVNQRDFRDIFRLLCNLSISKECRSMLWKCGFLMAFPAAADRGRNRRCTKQQQSLLQHWLKLMHCLSFFPDGQLNILKVHLL